MRMAPFVARGNLIVLASEDSILVVDATTGISRNASIPQLQKNIEKPDNKPSDKSTQNVNSEDYSHLNVGTCLALSACASFLAVCTTDKNLTVWELSSMEIVKQWRTSRKVSSVTFNSDSSILYVADKAGDCFSYLLPDAEEGQLILGHLSMLLDVVVSHDNKFIITSERDEKIRVSCLPNAYNIHAFCLGHTEFVTSLVWLKPNFLLSGSGDGTLRIWNYSEGRVLHVENLKQPKDDEMEKAVRSVIVHKVTDSLFIAAVLLDRVQDVLVFKVSDEKTFQRQTLPFKSQPLEVAFTEDGSLYVLTDSASNPIEFFVKDSLLQYALGESAIVSALLANTSHLKIIKDCVHSCNGDLKPLFKRWFDNVQLYREKKLEQQNKKEPVNADVTSSPKRLRVE